MKQSHNDYTQNELLKIEDELFNEEWDIIQNRNKNNLYIILYKWYLNDMINIKK